MQDHEQQDFYQDDLAIFIKTFKQIEQQRMSLNEDIAQILKDTDIVNMFQQVRKANKDGGAIDQSTANSQITLRDLIGKIEKRQTVIENQFNTTEIFHDQNVDLSNPMIINDFKTLGLYTKKDIEALDIKAPAEDAEKKEEAAKEHSLKNEESNPHLHQTDFHELFEDQWLLQNTLKIDRIRQRVQLQALKHLESKSSAEIALMFQGLNKIAYDVLMDNPMTGYMSQVVFTRILGNEEVESA